MDSVSLLLPADATGAARKIAEALARLGQRTVSRDLVKAFCAAAAQPPPFMEVIGLLAQRGHSVFFFSNVPGAYWALVKEGKAPHSAMLEAALKGETWVPPVPSVPEPLAASPVAPAPVLSAPVMLEVEGRLCLIKNMSRAERLAMFRGVADGRRGPKR